MNRILLTICSFFFVMISFAQVAPPQMGEVFGFSPDLDPPHNDELPPAVRQMMVKEVQQNIAELKKKGIIQESILRQPGEVTVKFGFPLRRAAGFDDPGFYGISNFVDHGGGGTPKDYNGGNRTYKDHLGTDFFTVPFWWKKKDENLVEIVAAADGIIVAKAWSRPDTSCAVCSVPYPDPCYNWNAVYVQHADGTVAFYGHMKQNSLTSKNVGESVVKGEFLGIVGSSGNSSGPHLHFEVWEDDTFTKLLDPWAGPQNPDYKDPSESLWESQEPYVNPQILKLYTADTVPEYSKQCYDGAPEVTNEKQSFAIGTDNVYFPLFVRDLQRANGRIAFSFSLYRPDGTLFSTWHHNGWAYNYTWAFVYYYYSSSSLAIPGEWTYRVVYEGTRIGEVKFNLYNPVPLDLVSFEARPSRENVLLSWRTENEKNTDRFEIERSVDGNSFATVGTVSAKGDGATGRNDYSFTDDAPLAGVQFYRLKMWDKDGKMKYSNVVKVSFDGVLAVKIFPNPANSFVELKNISGFNKAVISNMSGQVLLSRAIYGNEARLDISTLSQGLYIVRVTGEGKDVKVKLIKN